MQRKITPQAVADALLRRKWLFIPPLFLSLAISLMLVPTLPRFYRSQCVILVRPSELSREFVRAPVEYDVRDDLQNIEEQINSRTWMERVVDKIGLLPTGEQGAARDRLLQEMLGNIELEMKSRTSFTISYTSKDAELAHRVVEELAEMFIRENLDQAARSEQDAAFYLDEEVRTVEAELKAKEEELASYKQRYMGELPEQIDSNQRMLERLQVQQQMTADNLRDARDRRILLEGQISGLGEMGAAPGDPLVVELGQARLDLERLLSQYTEQHPDVIGARSRIQRLEGELAARGAQRAPGGTAVGARPGGQAGFGTTLQTELEGVKATILTLEAEEAQLKQEIRKYEARVEAAFPRQQELTELTRDYEKLDEYYRSLLDRKLNARLSSRVLRTHSANQYEIIDPPRKPLYPFRPDPLMVMLYGLAAGLALGGGLVLAAEALSDRFYSADLLEEDLGLAVLATIPRIVTPGDRRRLRRRMVVSLSALVLMAAAVTVVDLFVVDVQEVLRQALNRMIN